MAASYDTIGLSEGQCVEGIYRHPKSDAEMEQDKSDGEGDQDGCR
jgi:hypothetical protein